MLKAKYNRDISQLSQDIVETWQECINVYKGVKDHNNLTSVDHYKTHLEEAMYAIVTCKDNPPIREVLKQNCRNAVKAVKDSINGDIKVQFEDKFESNYKHANITVYYFEANPEKARELFKTCINEDGSLKSKKQLNKIHPDRYKACLNADKAINKNWIGSEKLRKNLIKFAKKYNL